MGGSRPPSPLAPVPPDVRAGGPDRKDREDIGPGRADEEPRAERSYADNDDATAAVTALVAAQGAWCVRVHQVPANADAVRVAAAYRAAARS